MSNFSNEVNYLYFITGIISGYGGSILFILGIVGNFINIFLFSYLPQLNKGSTLIFLLFSFIASQIYLLVILLSQIVYQFTGVDPLSIYLILCKIRWFIGTGSATVALHCLSLAAFNQYLLTSRNIQRHQWINRRRALFMCLFVIIYTMGFISPNLVYYTHVKNAMNQTQCGVTDPIGRTYDVYNGFVIYSLLPIIVLSTFSFLTWWNIKHKIARRAAMERSLTRLVFAQIAMVLLASIGFFIRRIYFLYYTNISKNSFQIAQDNLFNIIFLMIGHIIHSFSFYTYLFSSKAFRQNILSLFRKRQNRIQPIGGIRMKTITQTM
ncbi:hypothetical protein I4U23_011409 [Adineta vaga]|nr:hypothetical protein I4U23_011409 [Adineta vaga]